MLFVRKKYFEEHCLPLASCRLPLPAPPAPEGQTTIAVRPCSARGRHAARWTGSGRGAVPRLTPPPPFPRGTEGSRGRISQPDIWKPSALPRSGSRQQKERLFTTSNARWMRNSSQRYLGPSLGSKCCVQPGHQCSKINPRTRKDM